MAFAIRGYHSQKYLHATPKGGVRHADLDNHSLFILLPGCGPDSGRVKIQTAVSRSCLYCSGKGQKGLGVSRSDVSGTGQFWWIIEVDKNKGLFALQSVASKSRLYSNRDGRVSCWVPNSKFSDQLFTLEGEVYSIEHGDQACYGLTESGFCIGSSKVYMDALGRRFIINEQNQIKLKPWVPHPSGATWSSAKDLELCEMSDPHMFLIQHLPILQKLHKMGLINEELNEIWPERKAGTPGRAVRFALHPVSNGCRVGFRKDWKEAWHGSSLQSIPTVAARGLRSHNGRWIFVTPSWRYAFLLYSFDNVIPEQHERLRLVFQVRLRPDSYKAQADPYKFFKQEDFERHISANDMEWKLRDPNAVQVVGIVVKQLRPDHPFKLHGTYQCHLRKSLQAEHLLS